ncbi:MAG: hypothetical protein ACK4YP_17315 [Myxococcota bacterium]
MRTAWAAVLALGVAAACVPGDSASPERQAYGRYGDGDVEQGPIERVVTERHEERDRERQELRASQALAQQQATAADAARGSIADRGDADTLYANAWDLRLLDLLAIQLDVTAQLASAVAERGQTEALRAWAAEEVVNTARWRQELGDLRQAWYGDARPPRIEASPGLKDLGPITQRLAQRWSAGHQYSQDLDAPPAKTLTPAQEYARGVAPIVPAPDGMEDEAPFSSVATGSLVRLGGTVIPASVAVDSLAPMLRRAAAAGASGTMQASREELRAAALRIQLGEQRALTRLLAVAGGERG